MKREEGKLFLQRRREPKHQSCLVGVDKNLSEREDRAMQRKLEE